MFRGLYGMHATCSRCHVRFERDAGSFLGAMAIGYGLGALWVVALVVVEIAWAPIRATGLDPMWTIAASALPATALLYRPSKGLWMALLYTYGFVVTDEEHERAAQGETVA